MSWWAYWVIWCNSSLFYIFAISDRSWMKKSPHSPAMDAVVEFLWAFLLVGLPFTNVVTAVVALLRASQ